MQFLRAWHADATGNPDDRYVAVCDGIRILAIFLVTWFHIWQQSWLYPFITLFGRQISLDPLVRSGYMHVDLMILLSGFCLYLPYSRQTSDRKKLSVWQFYKKRLVRIVPSYYLTIAIMLIVALATDAYRNGYPTLSRDLISHLTFTQMFRLDTYYYTHLNAALWTMALEMQLYLVFPLLAWLMRKWAVPTTVAAVAACAWFRSILLNGQTDITPYFNQFPAYLDVFVIGMMTAVLYQRLCSLPHNTVTRILCSAGTVLGFVCIVRLAGLQSQMGGTELIQRGQLIHRLPMALAGAALILLAGNAGWLVRHILGNPLTHFLSGISMHIYIWNQVLAVWLRQLRVIPSLYENPNYEGDIWWQQRYTLLCFVSVLLVAILFTYAFERPVTRRLLRTKSEPAAKPKPDEILSTAERSPAMETVEPEFSDNREESNK